MTRVHGVKKEFGAPVGLEKEITFPSPFINFTFIGVQDIKDTFVLKIGGYPIQRVSREFVVAIE